MAASVGAAGGERRCKGPKQFYYPVLRGLRAWIGPSPQMASVIIGLDAITCPAPVHLRAPGASQRRNAMTRHVTLFGFVSALVLCGTLANGAVAQTAKDIEGVWTLVSADNVRPAGTEVVPEIRTGAEARFAPDKDEPE